MFFKVCMAVLALLPLAYLKPITIRGNSDPGTCAKENHGQLILVKDRENKDTLLVCTEDNGAYSWKTTDGSKPPGEYFNPGYDCLDILNKNTKAKDGFYWVDFNRAIPKRVWCDMTTDGGGYMLVGRMKNTVTWTVQSSNNTVKPFGDAQWASSFGDVPVLDFRVQVATSDDFKDTKSHWSFRLRKKRLLKNLLIVGRGGCAAESPGIGDIAYVKDLQTEEIVTKEFRCSKFGIYSHPLAKIGWTMMNSCFEKPCPWGFAFHSKYPIQVDYSGSFSFQIARNDSIKRTNGATAFFGCEKGQCCACYGPVGGKEGYCEEKCQTKNGTITKNASAWFWIRSHPSQKVWDKCMEYQAEAESGDTAWYKIVGDRQIPTKGRCGKNGPLLNNGIVVVPDVVAAKKIPPVAGLLVYRKDNQELRVRTNNTWKALVQEEKMIKILNTSLSRLETRLDNHENTEHSRLKTQLANANTDRTRLETELRNVNHSLGQFIQIMSDYSSSVILLSRPDFRQQIKQWLPDKRTWHLCYRATIDGWAASTFHSGCNNKGRTVTIVRVGIYIFGGYNDLSWTGSNSYKSSSNAFLFSLQNKDNLKSFKAPVYRYSHRAICDNSGYGPTFGAGHDLRIANNAHSSTNSYTDLGSTYQPPSGYSYGSSNTQALLAGSYHFTPSEVEVFYFG